MWIMQVCISDAIFSEAHTKKFEFAIYENIFVTYWGLSKPIAFFFQGTLLLPGKIQAALVYYLE